MRRGPRFLPVSMLLLTILLVIPASTVRPAVEPAPVAVIVNRSVAVQEISFAELRKLFLGDRKFWNQQTPVAIIVPNRNSPVRSVLLSRIYEKSESQYRQYWVGKVFRTEATSPPKEASSMESAVKLVKTIPGAVALIDAANLPQDVAVLRIDGKQPGQSGYPLQ